MDKLIFGLKVTALGMGIVFIALYALSLIIGLLEKTIGPKPEKILNQIPAKKTRPKTNPTQGEDQEIVAVIAAALFSQGITPGRIKTITPLNPKLPWAFAGRQAIMQKRKMRAK